MYLIILIYFGILRCILVNSETLSNPILTSRDVSTRKHGRCETMTMSLCTDLGYNETIVPNLLKHGSQDDAGLALHVFTPLIKVNCSDDLKLLLCAVFYPPCTILEEPLQPCRSICLSSRNGCEKLVKAFGFEWPEYLDCQQFPEVEPCVSKTGSPVVPDSPSGYDYSGPVVVGGGGAIGRNTHPIVTRDRFACPVHFMVPKGAGYSFRLNGKIYPDCGTPCDGLLFNQEEKKIISGNILVLSVLCLISALFTFCTHLLEPRRFLYPEKALKFLSVCYFVIALVHIIGISYGDKIACNEPFSPPENHPNAQMIRTTSQGTVKGSCTFTFMFLIFFGHSSYVWFTIVAFTWFLTSSLKWGNEAIEKISGCFHVIAWAIPALEMFRILAMKRIEGDTLSGVCFLDFWNRDDHRHLFDSVLYYFYLIVSLIFLFAGFISSCHVRQEFKFAGHDTYKLDNFMLRLTLFALFYLISSFALVAFNVYETVNIDSWMLSWQKDVCQSPDSGIPCPLLSPEKMPKKPKLEIFLLKYAARLVPGIALSLHLISKKTLISWINFHRRLWERLFCVRALPNETEKSLNS